MIRVSVATGDQFLMQLSDIVAASFPSSGGLFEMGIKRGFSPARLLFGKRATLQPARDRGMAYPNLVSNGRLREALFAQGHDLLVSSKALLSLRLLLLCFLWTQFRRLSRLRGGERSCS